jgi:hypothetical protein
MPKQARVYPWYYIHPSLIFASRAGNRKVLHAGIQCDNPTRKYLSEWPGDLAIVCTLKVT